tara:strand:+ start:39306 stop:40241 length:936 start_codon:yes stop_codon:yes gene_type:complete
MNGLDPIAFWPAHAEWRDNAEFDAALNRAALVVINGEGTIHHDRASGRRLLEVGEAARDAKKAIALINTGWEANGPALTKMLRNFDLVAARDTRSAMQMRKGTDTVRVVPDLSFYSVGLGENLRDRSALARSGIGFTDNVDRNRALELELLRRSISGRTVSIFSGDEGGYLKFLRNGLSLRQDPKNPRRAFDLIRLRHRLWVNRSPDTADFKYTLARLKFLVSGRFHATTLAVALGTPFMAQASNTGKIAALAGDIGLDEWRTSSNLTHQNVLDAADQGWSKREAENRKDYLDRARAESEMLFADLRKLVT